MDLEDDPNNYETSEEERTYSTDEDEIAFTVFIVLYFDAKLVYSVIRMTYLDSALQWLR